MIELFNKCKFLSESKIQSLYPLLYKWIIDNTSFLDNPSFIERRYCISHNIKETPKCVICNKKLKFISNVVGYQKTCSKECLSQLISNNVNNSKKQMIENQKKTFNRKYGSDYFMGSKEFYNKAKQTWLNKYGVDNPFKSKELMKNVKHSISNELRTKINNSLRDPTRKQKLKDKYFEKLGYFNISQSHIEHKEEYFNKDLFLEVCERLNYDVYDLCHYFNITNTIIHKKFREYNINIFRKSKFEKCIYELLKENNINFIHNDRKIIYPNELDFYLPDYNIAIECNGDYWHSIYQKPYKYHQNKSLECEKKGIRLIHIFECEWNSNKDKIKQWLLSNFNKDNRIYARKCIIKELDSKTSKQFLEDNHLQGNCNSSIKLGLFYNDELIEVMTFSKPRYNKEYEWELIRLASKLNYKIIGGASKLFNYFIKKYNPNNIISYQDFTKFNGNIYYNLGFNYKSLTEPGFFYTKDYMIVNRQKFQKYKLEQLLNKKIDNIEKTIYELGYLKIYNSGNKVWVWNKIERK